MWASLWCSCSTDTWILENIKRKWFHYPWGQISIWWKFIKWFKKRKRKKEGAAGAHGCLVKTWSQGGTYHRYSSLSVMLNVRWAPSVGFNCKIWTTLKCRMTQIHTHTQTPFPHNDFILFYLINLCCSVLAGWWGWMMRVGGDWGAGRAGVTIRKMMSVKYLKSKLIFSNKKHPKRR